MIHRPHALAILFVATVAMLAAPATVAGTSGITDAGVKNLGSTLAFTYHCEVKKFIAVGTFGEFMALVQKSFTAESWINIKNQYQKSVHEKEMYSIVKDRWLPFDISAKSCSEIESTIPTLMAAIRSMT